MDKHFDLVILPKNSQGYANAGHVVIGRHRLCVRDEHRSTRSNRASASVMPFEPSLEVTEWPTPVHVPDLGSYRGSAHWSEQAPILIDNGMSAAS